MILKNILKRNRILYYLYYYCMSILINLLKLFIVPDKKLILFVSYGGRHYSDSPRVIYEAMLTDNRFKNYKLVWAFIEPERFDVKNKIKIDSLKYFITALKARCWITNVMVERALNFKGKNTFYFHTTHGILVKKDGPDVKNKKFSPCAKYKYDISLAQSEYEQKIEMRIFGLPKEKIKIVGYPKDDILSSYSNEYREKIRRALGISEGKKVILYAPTFRENRDFNESFKLNIELWRKDLGKEYVLLYRAHPVVKAEDKIDNDFFIDVTSYEVVEELMIASDVLVSDYSGIIFDYCIMHKPIYLWTYDFAEYEKERGFYFDIREELKASETEKGVINMLKTHDWTSEPKEVVDFQKKYETVHGRGTENSLNLIYENILA